MSQSSHYSQKKEIKILFIWEDWSKKNWELYISVNVYNSWEYGRLISCYLFYSMEFKVILKTREINLPCYLIHNWEGKICISSFLKVICAKRNAADQARIWTQLSCTSLPIKKKERWILNKNNLFKSHFASFSVEMITLGLSPWVRLKTISLFSGKN